MFKLIRKNQAEGYNSGARNEIAGSATDVVLNTMTDYDENDQNIWIGGSGASCHYCNSEEGLYDYTTISEEITVGNGNKMIAKKVGNLRCTVQQKNGEKFVVVLENVKYVPDLWVNLFSINKALKNGFKIENEDVVLKLMKGKTTMYFDRILKTKDGFVTGIMLIPMMENVATTAVETMKTTITINNLHKILGH